METPLSKEAVRVLGALVEKEMSTPEYYPMTLNALRNACNQKSNRDPVVSYAEIDVMEALDELQQRRLAGHVTGAGSRAVKYRHALSEAFSLTAAECAGLACLMLRGPQTIGEVRSRTGRMYAFDDMAETIETLERLCSRGEPLVVHLGRMPGQKEVRFAHLLSGSVTESALLSASVGESASGAELEELRLELRRLREDFEAFRRQFE
ncbi:MAG: YceH family protein [Bacteroidetes bacterium]|nr:YceH family protein [Bacteroidota bacterium]